jgi:hypothetical protein
MRKLFLIISALLLLVTLGNAQSNLNRIILGEGNIGTDPYPTADIVLQNDEYITNYTDGTVQIVANILSLTGTIDPTITNSVAGGDRGMQMNITQSTSVDLTGTLVGIYARATGGDDGTAGTVRGCEIGGRVADVSGNIASVVTGGYFWADAKTRTATTLRGVEVSLDGGAGGTSTLAVAFEAFNNSSGTQTTSIAYDVNEGSASGRKAYTYDVRMQNGETIDNATNGAICFRGALNQAIAGGTNVVSAGLLGGAGTSTSAAQTLGAGADGQKAFSYYLSTTSTTAAHNLVGYYMCVNYGTSGASAAPSGDVIRGRAYLVGDAAGVTMISGGNFTTELAASTASNTGLTMGLKGNLVIPDGVMTNAGTYHGIQAEIFLSGAAVNTTAYTEISPLSICVSGTAPTSAAQLANIDAITFDFPANMVTNDATVMVTGGAADTCDAKLRIDVNGTKYWIMLSTDDE